LRCIIVELKLHHSQVPLCNSLKFVFPPATDQPLVMSQRIHAAASN
jgi:hypothetical protein